MKGQTSPQYAPHLWHDNPIYGLRLVIGDIEAGDWRSELVLEIDHIVGWECDRDGRAVLQVAPATLTVHDAADLRIAVDCGDNGGQIALHEWSIGQVIREPIPNRKVCLDRPFYRWRCSAGPTPRSSW